MDALADRIRKYANETHILPARENNRRFVCLRASDVHTGLGLDSRFPAVCGALDSKLFLDLAGVELVKQGGPEQSSTVEWVFALK